MKYNLRSNVQAGRLSHKLKIYTFTSVQNEWGQPIKTKVLKGEAWGHLQPVSSYEKMMSGRENVAQLMFKCELKFNKEIAVTDIIYSDYFKYDMNIKSISPRGRYNRERVELLLEVLEIDGVVND